MTTHLVTQPYRLPRDGGPTLWHFGAVLTFKATAVAPGLDLRVTRFGWPSYARPKGFEPLTF
jgi:hypothetical protein